MHLSLAHKMADELNIESGNEHYKVVKLTPRRFYEKIFDFCFFLRRA